MPQWLWMFLEPFTKAQEDFTSQNTLMYVADVVIFSAIVWVNLLLAKIIYLKVKKKKHKTE